jgi:AmiR/NasT family two-component response regulator
MAASPPSALRVLLADGQVETLDLVADLVVRLGHDVVAKETDIEMVAVLSEREPPDLAIVVAGESSAHALSLIRKIVRESACPVILLVTVEDPSFVTEAASLGVFGYVVSTDLSRGQLESAFAIVLRRFAEYHDLQGAFGRRAVTERAKGILMERHSIDDAAAFELLRGQARRSGRRILDVAQAVLDARSLLPKANTAHASPEREFAE